MALRAVKHKFTGTTTPIASYDSTKTNLGTLIVQNTGSTPQEKYVGPLPVGYTFPMQEAVETAGTVSVSTTAVTGSSTNFTASMVGMLIGFGSTNPSKITTWYSISARSSTTAITLGSSAGTIAAGTSYVVVSNIPGMFPHAITFSSTIDWVFLVENLATATAARRILMYEYNKTTSVYTWKGFINATLPNATAHTIRGFRVIRYLYNSGTVEVSGSMVTGTNTNWVTEGITPGLSGGVGIRIGFGSTNPADISTWYTLFDFYGETSLEINGTLTLPAGTSYVIEELQFAITTTNSTAANGGLFLVKGISYNDFVKTGTTIAAATTTDNVKAVYWLSDAGTTGNVVTNVSACGLALGNQINKGLHYAYVLDGVGSTYMKVYRYNLRATGTIASGKMTMSIAYTTSTSTSTTVTVSGTTVTNSGTAFTSSMVGMKIAFGTAGIANVTTWYTIASFTSTSVVELSSSAGSLGSGLAFIIDSADVICTGNQLVTGTVVGVNNGRIGTLNHGVGAGEESLYFVTATRIYRAAVSKIFDGNLGWISDNRPEIPPGSVSTFPATSALNSVEISDSIDRLIVLTSGATAFRQYVTRYPAVSGDQFDRIWGVDTKQQDSVATTGASYITSGTVAVSGTAVTGTNTFFVSSMVGYRIGFGSTDPNSISTWYTISAYTSVTSITLSSSAGTITAGSAYVIDWNSNTVPHFNTASQVVSVWSENGVMHVVKHGTTAVLSQMYALPFGADADFASDTNQCVITPALPTPDCDKYKSVTITHDDRLGSGEFSMNTEPTYLYYRTSGIDSNTGSWTLVPRDGDLSSEEGAPRIQFMLRFGVIGTFCIPPRVMSISVIYDDTNTKTDSHFEPSAAKSSGASKQFAWRFATAFGGTVPTLRVRIYNALTNDLLLDDYTVNSTGVWEKSTNGTTWGSYNTTDKGNETTFIRYTPGSLGDNIKVRAVLTQ